MQLWLYLHFPRLQLDALFAGQSAAPLIIVEGKKHQVVQLNSAAAEHGIRIGMGLGSAAALTTELQVHPYNRRAEQRSLTDIAQWLYLVTSDIVLFPPQGILLKVTNMLTLYDGLDNYWQQLKSHLDQLALSYHYACGFSPYSAMLLAQSGRDLLCDNKQRLRDILLSYPVTATELAPAVIGQLQRIGIGQLQDLVALPMQDLARRFDVDLVNYVGRLMGQFKHPLDFYLPTEQFRHTLELLFDIEQVQWLEKPLLRLLTKLQQFLLLRNLVGYELELILQQRDQPDVSISITSASGDYQSERWLRLCQLRLESLTLAAPVQSLTLAIVRSGPQQASSQDLFSGKTGQQTSLELVSLLQAKLGQNKVNKLMFTDDPRPERSTQLCPPEQACRLTLTSAKLRPSIMLPVPEPLTEKVQLLQGPERIVTGWWDGDDITRDYFIARSNSGRWLWVFRNQHKRWFLHGQFS
ncbi:Y-family DNA polymerase [Vibrio sp.]|uniref:Y-family DNA polymerase n=1 Tax=Vibrio sp. TaxID=678 RepID=UPI003D0E2870